MRHHIVAIAEYAKAGDTSAILAYIGEYSTEISEAAVKRYSLNRTINSILSACQKYDGNLDYTIENNVCSVCAVLNL